MISPKLAWMYLIDRVANLFAVVSNSSFIRDLCTSKYWEQMKWFANGCFIGGTLIMISPDIAAKSTIPWVAYLTANLIWFTDSAWTKNKPWFWMASFFITWDIVLILSRII